MYVCVCVVRTLCTFPPFPIKSPQMLTFYICGEETNNKFYTGASRIDGQTVGFGPFRVATRRASACAMDGLRPGSYGHLLIDYIIIVMSAGRK